MSTASPQMATIAPRRLGDWIGSILFLPVFGLILVIFDPLQRTARSISFHAHEKIVALLNSALCLSLRLAGTRVEIYKSDTAPLGGPALIVSNHQSLFDIPLLYRCFRNSFPRFIAKQELARWIPSVSYNLRRGGNAIIDRSNARQSLRVLQDLGTRMNALRFSTVLFPEGTRARDGTLKQFKSAGFATLMNALPNVPIIPVAIDGSWRLASRHCFPVPWGCRIRISIGTPISLSPETSAKSALDKCHDFIEEQLNRSPDVQGASRRKVETLFE